MRITHRVVLCASIVSLLMIMFVVALFWGFPSLFPGFSFQIILLALGSVSSLINVYKFVVGYSTEELLHIMRRYNAKTVINRYKREIDKSQNRAELIGILDSLKREIDQFVDHLESDEKE